MAQVTKVEGLKAARHAKPSATRPTLTSVLPARGAAPSWAPTAVPGEGRLPHAPSGPQAVGLRVRTLLQKT